MVVSNIIQNIKFKEEKEVEKHDKKTQGIPLSSAGQFYFFANWP